MPWNQSTIVGFFCDVCYVLTMGAVVCFANGLLILLFISICHHHRAFRDVFRQLMDKRTRNSTKNDYIFMYQLIRFQNSVKGLRKPHLMTMKFTKLMNNSKKQCALPLSFTLQMVFAYSHHLWSNRWNTICMQCHHCANHYVWNGFCNWKQLWALFASRVDFGILSFDSIYF